MDPKKKLKIYSKIVPKSYWLQRAFEVLFGIILGLLAKRPQDGAQTAQEGAKMVPDRPKTGLRWPRIGLRWSKTGPK